MSKYVYGFSPLRSLWIILSHSGAPTDVSEKTKCCVEYPLNPRQTLQDFGARFNRFQPYSGTPFQDALSSLFKYLLTKH